MKSISIIPNTSLLNIPFYHEEKNNVSHTKLLQNFCSMVGLDYTNYRTVHECLLSHGLIIITTSNTDYAITWLPENIVEEQRKELFHLNYFYQKFQDLEFLDIYDNGLGKYSDKKNTGLQVLSEFYEALRIYQNKRGQIKN